MRQRAWWATGFLLSLWAGQCFAADEVRYFEKDGVTYRETRQTVKRPLSQTQYEPREQTTYREKFTTDLQSTIRTYQVPITEYQWVSYWQYSLNPFAKPFLAYRQVPQTRWETRSETVKIPVTRREVVPEKTTVQVPVTTQRLAEEEVVTRVAIGTKPMTPPGLAPAGAAAGAAPLASIPGTQSAIGVTRPTVDPFANQSAADLARRYSVGGVTKFESDPPRQGSTWRAADPTVRR